jgi:prevent-host-death family protein
MKMVTIQEAKTNLSELIEKVCEGQEIIIVRGSKPLVRLAPVASSKVPRRPGALKGKLRVGRESWQ